MARLSNLRSVPPVLAAALTLAACSSTRIDPLEFDYYSSAGAPNTAAYTPGATTPAPVPAAAPARAETAPIVPIGGGAAEPEPVAAATTITVQKGDSLYRISQRHLGSGKRWPEIARLNGLSDADVRRLPVGRKLKLPPR